MLIKNDITKRWMIAWLPKLNVWVKSNFGHKKMMMIFSCCCHEYDLNWNPGQDYGLSALTKDATVECIDHSETFLFSHWRLLHMIFEIGKERSKKSLPKLAVANMITEPIGMGHLHIVWNYSKCRSWIFFWHFPPIFVSLKLTCLVTLFDRKLQVFKNSPKWTIFGIFN